MAMCLHQERINVVRCHLLLHVNGASCLVSVRRRMHRMPTSVVARHLLEAFRGSCAM